MVATPRHATCQLQPCSRLLTTATTTPSHVATMALVDYASDSDGDMAATSFPRAPLVPAPIVAAPEISLEDPMQLRQSLIKPTDRSITHNMTYEQLSAPEAGPQNPFIGTDTANRKRKNVPTGYAEQSGISDATFRAQHRTFNSLGYAAVGDGYAGDQQAALANRGKDVVQLRPSKKEVEAIRRKRQRKGDAAVLDGEGAYLGPWARYNEAALATRDDEEGEEYEEEEEEEEEVVAPVSNPIIDKAGREYLDVNTGGVGKETTEFHGSEMYDYQGRTYMHVPQDLDIDLRKEPGSTTNFIPKKLVHTWKGHTKPITALRFFPTSGHLLLSSASDSKVKASILHSLYCFRMLM
jgi:pre-mRNA-processing factor 17